MLCFKNQFFNNKLYSQATIKIFKRHKSNKKKVPPISYALDHFDDFYKNIFADKWPSVRLGLLTKKKYVAVLNNFGDIEKTKKFLEQLGAHNLKSYLENQKNFCINNDKKVVKSVKNENKIDEIISYQLQQEDIKESNHFYSNKDEAISNPKFIDEETVKTEQEKDYIYDFNNPSTSLHADMAEAKIQTDRLILPGSNSNNSLFEFVPVTELRGVSSYISESEYYKYYKKKSDFAVNIDPEFVFDFPEMLHVFSFDRGDLTDFPAPEKCANDVYNFLAVDGAQLLPVVALGVEIGDKVLHISSTSAEMGYCILQSLLASNLVCSGKADYNKIFSNYLYDYSQNWNDMLLISEKFYWDTESTSSDSFDKILINVPCTEDKKSLFDLEDNIFSRSEIKKRISLPQYQCRILANALNLVQVGGTVVYSTFTLSPVQNDGVVNEALKISWEETKSEFTIKDLSPALTHTNIFFNYGNYLNLKYGTLVVPFLPSNFGPLYFCKIVKNK